MLYSDSTSLFFRSSNLSKVIKKSPVDKVRTACSRTVLTLPYLMKWPQRVLLTVRKKKSTGVRSSE